MYYATNSNNFVEKKLVEPFVLWDKLTAIVLSLIII